MNPTPFSIVLLTLCFLTHLAADISINCGSFGTFTSTNGRKWIGDLKPKFSSLLQIQGSSTTSTLIHKLVSTDQLPHNTARISRSQFSYTFLVNPGQKIIRLHFNPSPYKGFKGLHDLFTVEAAHFILLANFSASLTAHALGVKSFSKEFCLNIQENEAFVLTFSPDQSSRSLDTYAFINGIEIISVPDSVSYFHDNDTGIQVVGQKSMVYIDHRTALELIHRLNIKQSSVTSHGDFDDTFPMWALREAARVKDNTWKIPVDVGFRYMIRLHFSETGLKIVRNGDVVFKVVINEVIAHTNIDTAREKDEDSVPWYKDYVVMMIGQRKEGKRDLTISVQSHDEIIDGNRFLAGFEIFKLSNLDKSLASPNPLPPSQGSPSKTSLILFSILSQRNTISTVAITIISLVCIVVRKWCEYWEANSNKEENKPSARAERLCRRFSLVEIQLATRNFSGALLIGKGGFGKVYKGLIDRGQTTVAVKRLKSNSMQGAHEFLMEIETLSELRHVNLVSLIGYCNEQREMILVYEYMAGGTLADHLHKLPRESDKCSSLNWKQRLNICIGAGRGLDYLHTGHGVIHRDVKTSNILLDDNFVAKVADFGLAKHEDRSKLQSHVSTRVKGTNGYLDPHYIHTRKLTRKTDTYAFGVVLLEILCGRRAVDLSAAEDEHILTIWARDMLNKGEVESIVASGLREEISPASRRTFVEIVERCLRDEPKNRPTMSQVVLQLELALEKQEIKEVLVLNEITSTSGDPHSPVHDETDVATHVPNITSPPVVNAGLSFERKEGRKATMRKPSRLWTWDTFWNRVKPSKKNEFLLSDIAEIGDEIRDANINVTKFDWVTIAAATDQFSPSNKVGEGGFGPVYKGLLPSGQVVAVKRLSPYNKQGPSEFKNEILLLPKLQHRNIIKLLGYCILGAESLLIYEFMENTSLNAFIFGKSRQPLEWGVRFKIITGIARGVVYLHQDSGLRVIYRDLKASKILLDSEMNPKISDFALARTLAENQSELETIRRVGTYGYMSPEYSKYRKFSVKSDVYSFGIVVLEIVSGRRMHGSIPESMISLLDYAWKLWNDDRAFDLVDESLIGAFPEEEALRCIKVGLLCTQVEPNHRPTMPCVLKMLEGDRISMKLQQTKSFNEVCEEICDANVNLAKFDWDTIATATNLFSASNKIGQNRFVKVYKGALSTTMQDIAVKRFSPSSNLNLEEFENEILLLPKIQHQNIIKLLGYCIHGEEKMLVYEFMENTSLDTFIFGEAQQRQRLPWPVRFEIIKGIARGVAYLQHDSGLADVHSDLLFSNILKDLKSSNVLLDNEMNPKISDFGIASTTSGIAWNFGYISPERLTEGTCSDESDVYSFGIIVLEVVSGKTIMGCHSESTIFLVDYAWKLWNEGKAYDLVDESLGGSFSGDEVLRCIQVGLFCTQPGPYYRPSILTVLRMLQGKELQDKLFLEPGPPREHLTSSSLCTDDGLIDSNATLEIDGTNER